MQAAHIRNLLDVGVASGKYDMKTARCTPLDSLMSMYDFPLANARGGFLSHAAAQLEMATASALRSLAHARPFEPDPFLVLGAVSSFLEPFRGHSSPKVIKIFQN